MERPNYYAIIPAEVRYSDLKPSAKLLFGELTALSNKYGYCFASNNYFANLYGVTKNTISLWISDLSKAGFITVDVKRDNNKQVIKRKIGITKKSDSPIMKKSEYNNTSINNTTNNNNMVEFRKMKFGTEVSQLSAELQMSVEEANDFLDYWTEKNPKGKMRFEKEKVFDINLRLKRWIKNTKMWSKKTAAGKEYYLKTKARVKSNTQTNINTWKAARDMLDDINT